MKQRLQNLCDSRVTALIILQIVPLIPTLITVCTNFSVAALIAFLIAIAIALWLISGLVKVQKGALEAGTNTIRRFMKFLYVLVWILVALGIIRSVILIIGLLSVNNMNSNKEVTFLTLFIIGLIAFLVYELLAVRALKNTSRRAHEIAIGTEYVSRQGKLPEVYCIIEIIFSLLSLFNFFIPEFFGAVFELEYVPIPFNVSFTSLLNTALTIIRAIISYSLLCDFRKAVNE